MNEILRSFNAEVELQARKRAPRSFGIDWMVGCLLVFSLVVFSLVSGTSAGAREFAKPKEGHSNETPQSLENLDIEQRLGEKVDLEATFLDHEGKTVRLADYVKDGKPLLLSLAYFNCPSLCNFHLNGLNDAFKAMAKPLGDEFNVVIVSFDPKEKTPLASAKRENYLKAYGRPDGAKGWHFLTGESAAIEPLAKAVGFKYRWDEEQKQYAHAAAAYAISPDGTISRYFYGITFDPKTVRLSMIEASKGLVGSLVDKLTLFCFHYDPKESRYTVAAFNVMRAGGVMMLLVLGAFLLPFWIRARKEAGAVKAGAETEK